ncbi:MAG: hypothetical protein ACK5JF_02785 [Oscillospiraceae bacterium]
MQGFGRPSIERQAIEATYEDTLEVWRPADKTSNNITSTKSEKVAENVICAYSGGGGMGNQTDSFNLVEYAPKIFAPPELTVLRGDVIKLKRFGRIDPNATTVLQFEPLGDAALFPTHQEIFVKVRDRA